MNSALIVIGHSVFDIGYSNLKLIAMRAHLIKYDENIVALS
jgi:hypothetical protein